MINSCTAFQQNSLMTLKHRANTIQSVCIFAYVFIKCYKARLVCLNKIEKNDCGHKPF